MRLRAGAGGQIAERGARVVAHPVLQKGRRRTDRYAANSERAALAALDKFNRGVFLLDLDGTVSFANRAAEKMVARDDGLLLRKNRLQFNCPASQAALEQFLAEGAGESGESLVLCTQGAAKRCKYRVLVSPLEHGAGYCAFVYEPNGGHRELPIGVLRGLYRLTPAEAHLVNELFAGKSLAQAARARGISINTAKYTLKSIFSKCEVSSRAELLLLLSLGPRTL
jgi:DNA-binding CsgD family transcriptional regulator